MLTSITKLNTNPQQERGDSSVKNGAPSDRELFEQFTEILDKIASSLNHAKKSNENQAVSDMSAALGQAAAAQIQRVVPPVERTQVTTKQTAQSQPATIENEQVKNGTQQALERNVPKAVDQSVAKEVSDPQSQQSSNKEQVQPVAVQAAPEQQQQSAPLVVNQGENLAESPVTQVAAESVVTEVVSESEVIEVVSEVPENKIANSKKIDSINDQVETVPVVTQPTVQVNEKSEVALKAIQEPVVVEQISEIAVATQDAPEIVATAPPVNEAPEATNLKPTTAQAISAQELTEQELKEVPVTELKGQEIAKTEQNKPVELATSQATAPTENELIEETKHTIDQVLASQQQIAPQLKLMTEKSNEELITQSIEALLHQVAFAGVGKSALEVTLSSQSRGHGRQIQGIQAVGNSQFLGTAQADQGRQLQTNREKAPVKELPRALANRTMERVESALKEVARSKDGKTISLRLDPPSLGTLKIDVTLKDGQLHARFVGESAQVNALLREQAHDLQQMLRKAGVQAEKIIITVGNDRMTDLNEGSQTFDKQASQQFRDSTSRSNGFAGSASNASATDSLGKIQIQQPIDHWVA